MSVLPVRRRPVRRLLGRRDTALARLAEIDALERQWRGPSGAQSQQRRIDTQLRAILERSGVTCGRVLEIGAGPRPRAHVFGPGFTYRDLDPSPEPAPDGRRVVTADITDCPQLKDATFDVVISIDVFGHLERPWRAAAEIERLLAPGGLAYTSAGFSGRYDPAPIDFWRFTPDALESLFAGLVTLDKGFDVGARRRDVRERCAQDPTPVDALGGWRENVRVFHAGIKAAA